MSTEPSQPTWRRWIVPAGCVLVGILGMGVPALAALADLDPLILFYMRMVGIPLTLLCGIVLVVWFFVFSGLPTRLRWGVFALVALPGVTGFALIREIDFTGDFYPIARFRWETTAQQKLDTYLEHARDEEVELPPIDLRVDPGNDFPCYRGATGDGFVTPTKPLEIDWEKQSPKILWRQPCGGGFSGFAVAGNVAITLEQRHDDEVLVCYDRATGRQRWECAYKARFRDIFGDGPRGTPAIHDGKVYSLGATGELLCADGKTGKELWRKNVLNGRTTPVTWGVSGSPVVVADRGMVLVCPGGKIGPSLAAYDLVTGSLKWETGEAASGYSSPHLATLAGQRQVLLFDADGLAGFDLDGKELWRHGWKTNQDMNIIQPVVLDGGRVFVSSETTNGCALVRVAKTKEGFKPALVWENTLMGAKYANPVALGGSIYGMDMGVLTCLDQQTGARRWRGRRYGHGQILAIGGALLIVSERGEVALVAADTKRFRELGLISLFRDKTWNTPALAGRHLFIRNAREMACIELPVRE